MEEMIRGRFARKWGVLVVVMACLFYTCFYLSTQHEFKVDVSLKRPRKGVAPFPWELDPDSEDLEAVDSGKFPNRAIQGHGGNETRELKDATMATVKPRTENEVAKEGAKETVVNDDFMKTRAEINRLRRDVIKRTCERYPDLARGPISDNTKRHIYVNDQQKLLYCFVPKVGCSNWKRVMMVLNGNKKKMSEMSSNEVHLSNGMKRLAGYSKVEQGEKLRTYKTFMYARNPLLRVLSAYNNKYGDIIQYRKDKYFQGFAKTIMKKFRPRATARELQTGENITWTEFVKFLTQPQRPFFDDHWEEMYKLCSPCKVDYQYVGQLETVSEDAKYMLKDLKLDTLVGYPSRSNSHPTNSTAEFEKAFNVLPKENVLKLWKIYEKDFELFDYPKPDFV